MGRGSSKAGGGSAGNAGNGGSSGPGISFMISSGNQADYKAALVNASNGSTVQFSYQNPVMDRPITATFTKTGRNMWQRDADGEVDHHIWSDDEVAARTMGRSYSFKGSNIKS